LADKHLQLEIEDGDKIDFFTEQLGGRDNIQHNSDKVLEQMNVCQNIQAPCDVAQDQTRFVENAQPVTHAVNHPGSQIAACPSLGNAEMDGRGGLSNERMNRNTTLERVGRTQNVPANENTPATPQPSRAPLSMEVTDESGSSQLRLKMMPEVPMDKLMLNACARWGTPLDVSCVLLDGRRIYPNDTHALVCSSRRVPLDRMQ
jgi:hypothetical protein